MARTLIATHTLKPNTAYSAVTTTAGDSANGMYFVDDGNTLLFAQNGDASTHTVTMVSVADGLGRTGDLVVTVPANNTNNDGISLFGLPSGQGWRQAGTNQISVNLSASTKMLVSALQVVRYG